MAKRTKASIELEKKNTVDALARRTAGDAPRFSESKTPEGMEAIGVNKDGSLKYAPMGDVYSGTPQREVDTQGAPKALAISRDDDLSAAVAPGDPGPANPRTKERSAEDIRANYQDEYSTLELRESAQRSMDTRGGSFQGPEPVRNMDAYRGPASQREQITPSMSPTSEPKRSDSADRYTRAQDEYQTRGEGYLDPAKAREMDSIYKEADSLGQATITGNSMRRAQGELNAATDMSGAPRATPVPQPDRMSNTASPAPARTSATPAKRDLWYKRPTNPARRGPASKR